MKIIVGHTNMDLDCLGSMALARYLYPDHVLVRSRLIHPVAKHLYNLYQNHLNMVSLKELDHTPIEHMVILDTRSRARVKEYFESFDSQSFPIDIYDHHTQEKSDIQGAVLHERPAGANTTIIGAELLDRGIQVAHDDAVIALTGIYADTGNFTHENVTLDDFRVAAYLVKRDVSIGMIKKFLKTLKDGHQITLFHEVLNRLYYAELNGHFITLSFLELEHQQGGLAAVVEKVFEVENSDAIFSVFGFKKEKSAIIIARSQKDTIDVQALLTEFGGGGHRHAASALRKKAVGLDVFNDLQIHLQKNLIPAIKVDQLMSSPVETINENWSLLEASKFLEHINHTGAPVVDEYQEIVGFMTLRDIMKGRKVNAMHAPVKAYMSKKVVTVKRNATMRDVEDLFYAHNIGHLPVVTDSHIDGIITRSDFIEFLEQSKNDEPRLLFEKEH